MKNLILKEKARKIMLKHKQLQLLNSLLNQHNKNLCNKKLKMLLNNQKNHKNNHHNNQ